MASRTYLPLLLHLLKKVCRYISEHRERIISVIGSQHTAKLDAIVTACELFTEVALPFIEPGI